MVGISFYSEVYNCNQTKEGEMIYEEENIVTESYRFVKSGQKSNNISCGADDGLWTDVTQDQYNLMTPDNAIIKVIKNRKFYTFNYDFKNKDMVPDDSNSDINIYQWSSNDMAKKTVKPNFDCVIVNSDDNLNSDELSYYTKIQVRVTKKLADIQ